jgi:hypothetical protein
MENKNEKQEKVFMAVDPNLFNLLKNKLEEMPIPFKDFKTILPILNQIQQSQGVKIDETENPIERPKTKKDE